MVNFLTHVAFGVMSQSKGQGHLKVKFDAIVFIINYKAFYCMFLALLNVGMTFRLPTILGDFDKMTCLCRGVGGNLDFRDPLHPNFVSFFIDLHVLLDVGSFYYPRFFFPHISSLCKVVLMKDGKIHWLLFKLGKRPF